MLTDSEKKTLLKLAREAIEARVRGAKTAKAEVETETLKADAGAFVSIHKDGNLRGCIGTFASPNALYKTVMDMAVAAATKDPRFVPVTERELKDIHLEISVLSPLKEVSGPDEIEVGRHGLYIVKGTRRGVLLPQVAIEHGFDKYAFLDQTCLKAGLPTGAWRDGATVFTFEAEIFREEEGR